ncbi:transglutaminase family protein [Flavobacterium sp. RHBU_24]|uniref:transglutaminase family protein n=1 Tax=Flavobacterium sp. RHBU_24 TaxID=3391185 RepID=UPI003985082A
MPLYHIKHITRYHYPEAVTDSANQIILKPQDSDYQEVKSQVISIKPSAPVDYFLDYLGNTVGVFTIVEPHYTLEIISNLEVETRAIPQPEPTVMPHEEWKTLAEINNNYEFMDFCKPEFYEARPEIEAVVKSFCTADTSVYETITSLSAYIYNNFTYKQGVTTIETGIDEIWALKAGVCQDFAHLLSEMLRLLGIPSRYISGFICPADYEIRGEGATHAWVEAFIPGYGWFGIDPTNNCSVSDGHVKIAFGRNFNDCTPVKGTYKGTGSHTLTVAVSISNDKNETEQPIAPVYIAESPKPSTNMHMNSYQKFLDMQQQQQQQ